MADAWLITGIPAAGKTTTARLLAERLGQGVHIEGDLLQEWIVSDGVWPGEEPARESSRQIRLSIRNQCLLARSYADAGFTPVIDYIVAGRAVLQEFLGQLTGLTVHFVMLTPGKSVALERDEGREKSQSYKASRGVRIAERWSYLDDDMKAELGGTGFWVGNARLSPEQTVDVIMANKERARLAS